MAQGVVGVLQRKRERGYSGVSRFSRTFPYIYLLISLLVPLMSHLALHSPGNESPGPILSHRALYSPGNESPGPIMSHLAPYSPSNEYSHVVMVRMSLIGWVDELLPITEALEGVVRVVADV